MGDELKEGWGNPDPMNRQSKFHYFGADGRSLCGKWAKFLTTIDSDDKDEHADNCAGCKKKVAKYRASKVEARRG